MLTTDGELGELVAKTLEDRAVALVGRDEVLLRSLLHDDFSYTNASGERFDADGYVGLTIAGPLVWVRQDTRVGSIVRAGDVVVVAADVADDVRVEDSLHSWEFTSTQVYVVDPDGLRYLAGHTGPAVGPG